MIEICHVCESMVGSQNRWIDETVANVLLLFYAYAQYRNETTYSYGSSEVEYNKMKSSDNYGVNSRTVGIFQH